MREEERACRTEATVPSSSRRGLVVVASSASIARFSCPPLLGPAAGSGGRRVSPSCSTSTATCLCLLAARDPCCEFDCELDSEFGCGLEFD